MERLNPITFDFDPIRRNPLFAKLASHVFSFMDENRLWPDSKKARVALSGGADSILMSLLAKEAIIQKRLESIECLHFHHGSRHGQDQEADFVLRFCDKLNVTCRVVKLEMGNAQGNFENLARNARNEIYDQDMKEGELLYLGHHIDDSFEWSLMQQMKSSGLKSSLGIPVLNKQKARPLMCLSGEQIRFILKKLNVPFVIDPTNADGRFERNWFRKNVTETLKENYSACLKNYVQRSNQLALELGLHRKKQNGRQWVRFLDRFGGVGLYDLDSKPFFDGGSEQLVDLIKKVSGGERGRLRDQVQKMIAAANKGKKGPMLFSGDVQGFMDTGVFYFQHSDKIDQIHHFDGELAQKLEYSQIPVRNLEEEYKSFKESSEHYTFPFLITSSDRNAAKVFGPGLKRPHPLFPRTTGKLLERGVYFQTITRASIYRARHNSGIKTFSFGFIE